MPDRRRLRHSAACSRKRRNLGIKYVPACDCVSASSVCREYYTTRRSPLSAAAAACGGAHESRAYARRWFYAPCNCERCECMCVRARARVCWCWSVCVCVCESVCICQCHTSGGVDGGGGAVEIQPGERLYVSVALTQKHASADLTSDLRRADKHTLTLSTRTHACAHIQFRELTTNSAGVVFISLPPRERECTTTTTTMKTTFCVAPSRNMHSNARTRLCSDTAREHARTRANNPQPMRVPRQVCSCVLENGFKGEASLLRDSRECSAHTCVDTHVIDGRVCVSMSVV